VGIKKDYIEPYIIWLKEDLKISESIAAIKQKLLQQITLTHAFNDRISAYFTVDKYDYSEELTASHGLPSQVKVLMEALTALDHAEQAMAWLERTDLTSSSAVISAKLLTGLPWFTENVYQLFHFVNYTPKSLYPIIKPIADNILPQLSVALPSFEKLSSALEFEDGIEQLGATTAQYVTRLPNHQVTKTELSDGIVEQLSRVPLVFERLAQALNITDVDVIDRKLLLSKRQATQIELERFIGSENAISQTVNFAKLMRSIIKMLSLPTTLSIPLSHEGAVMGRSLLNKLRHKNIPQLFAELQRQERELGLASGSLTEPSMRAVERAYDRLVHYTDALVKFEQKTKRAEQKRIAKAGAPLSHDKSAGGDSELQGFELELSEPLLADRKLRDHQFYQASKFELYSQRLQPYLWLVELENHKSVAQKFFNKIQKLHSIFHLGKLALIPTQEKFELIALYNQIQPYFDSRNPYIASIMSSLTHISDNERLSHIKELKLTSEQKELLADALQHSVYSVEVFIDGLAHLSKEEKLFYKDLLCHEQCLTETFSEKVLSIKDDLGSYSDRFIKYASDTVVTSLYYTAVAGSLLFPSIDDFINILNQKKSVLAGIEQDITDQQFQIAEIENQIQALHDVQYGESYKHSVSTSDAIYRPILKSLIHPKDDVEDIKYETAILKIQQQQLSQYQKTAQSFYEICRAYPSELPLSELDEADRRDLWKYFLILQPYIAHLDPHARSHENALLSALNQPADYTVNDVLYYEAAINSALTTEMIQSSSEIDRISHLYEAKRQLEQSVVAISPDAALTKSLLEHIRDLDLVQQIEAFESRVLVPTLKQNLSERILLELDLDNITYPIDAFYQDIEIVAFYKQFLNSIYFLKKSITDIEYLAGKKEPDAFFSKLDFIIRSLNGLSYDFYSSMYYLMKMGEQPLVKGLQQELQHLIAPLKALPGVNLVEYFGEDQASPLTESKSIITLWNEQMEIVRKELRITYPENLEDPAVVISTPSSYEPVASEHSGEEEVKISDFFEVLYLSKLIWLEKQTTGEELTDETKRTIEIEAKRQAQKTISSLKAIMKFSKKTAFPWTFNKYLNGALEVVKEVYNGGYTSKKFILSELDNIADQILDLILSASDSTEIELGFDFGKTTTPAIAAFNRFYVDLINGLALSEEEKEIFVVSVSDKINQKRLNKTIAEKEKIEADLSSDVTAELFDECLQVFSDFLKHDAEQFSVPPHGDENRIKFLKTYDALQPYLNRINYHMDRKYYLRALQTDADFFKAAQEIYALKNNLNVLAATVKRSKEVTVLQLQDRISTLSEQKHRLHDSIIDARKEKYKWVVATNRIKSIINTLDLTIDGNDLFSSTLAREARNQLWAVIHLDAIGASMGLHQYIDDKLDRIAPSVIASVSELKTKLVDVQQYYLGLKATYEELMQFPSDPYIELAKTETMAFIDVIDNLIKSESLSISDLDNMLNEISKHTLKHQKNLANVDAYLKLKSVVTYLDKNDLTVPVTLLACLDDVVEDLSELDVFTSGEYLLVYMDAYLTQSIDKLAPKYLNNFYSTFVTQVRENCFQAAHKLFDAIELSELTIDKVEELVDGVIDANHHSYLSIKEALEQLGEFHQYLLDENIVIITPQDAEIAESKRSFIFSEIEKNLQLLHDAKNFEMLKLSIKQRLFERDHIIGRINKYRELDFIAVEIDKVISQLSDDPSSKLVTEQLNALTKLKAHASQLSPTTDPFVQLDLIKNDFISNLAVLKKVKYKNIIHRIAAFIFGAKLADQWFLTQEQQSQRNLVKRQVETLEQNFHSFESASNQQRLTFILDPSVALQQRQLLLHGLSKAQFLALMEKYRQVTPDNQELMPLLSIEQIFILLESALIEQSQKSELFSALPEKMTEQVIEQIVTCRGVNGLSMPQKIAYLSCLPADVVNEYLYVHRQDKSVIKLHQKLQVELPDVILPIDFSDLLQQPSPIEPTTVSQALSTNGFFSASTQPNTPLSETDEDLADVNSQQHSPR
jgi:hypothetical protein